MVEIYKLPNENLGVVLTKSVRAGKVVVCIESIKPASIADRWVISFFDLKVYFTNEVDKSCLYVLLQNIKLFIFSYAKSFKLVCLNG